MDKEVENNNMGSHQTDHFAPLEMVDYMLCNNPSPQPQISLDKLSFADVMQFADFGPKLALMNQPKMPGDVAVDENNYSLMAPPPPPPFPLPLPPLRAARGTKRLVEDEEDEGHKEDEEEEGEEEEEEEDDADETCRFTETATSVQFLGGFQKAAEAKNRRKRPRSLKTTEEVESQRMTHIAVERNRRRQMNEHLRMLRSLMPGSYVQRGDQASIIGGAIEFVRELEQLLQCLESQKRRRLFGGGEAPKTTTDASPLPLPPLPLPIHQPFFPPLPLPGGDHMKLLDLDPNGLREEMVENKSCLADIEVRLLGFDAMIKILSRRRPSQLLKIIAAFEDLQFNILHTNVTTIEQTVLYSFNVKITGETMYTTEDIANFVQQILSYIDANTL